MKRLLTIDGGGVRGVIALTVLAHLESKLDRPIQNYFDLMAGTSTGGIIVSALSVPDEDRPGQFKYSARKVLELYLQNIPLIFSRSMFRRIFWLLDLLHPKYSSANLRLTLENEIGQVMLSEVVHDLLLVSYDIENGHPFYFKSRKAKNDKNMDWPLIDGVLATSAAPTYFTPHQISKGEAYFTLIDGGVFSNNPALSAYVESKKLYGDEEIFLLSVGTGESRKKYGYNKARNWGITEWALPLIEIVGDGISDAVDHQLTMLLNRGDKDSYIRLQPDLGSVDIDLDDASKKSISRMQQIAGEYIRENETLLDVCVANLKS